MKTLYLMRHAKSSWKNPELEDHKRPLNKRGKHDVVNLFYTPPIPKFPTAGIVTLVFDIDSWQKIDPKRLIYSSFDFPKNVP